MQRSPRDEGLQRMIECLDQVLARIERELARAHTNHEQESTARVGGITRLGATLDAYLLSVWRWVCARLGLDPMAAAREISPQFLLDRATAGQLLFLLERYSRHSIAHEEPVRCLFLEMAHGSALRRTIELRNQIVHARVAPRGDEIQRVLYALRIVLSQQRVSLETLR
jgi:uncharacterized protein YutE (UPF0331/DUF86 family)